jgi:hypothetical protein
MQMCRICYSTSEPQEEPLLSPCNCKDSINLVHVSCCLEQWLTHTGRDYCDLCAFRFKVRLVPPQNISGSEVSHSSRTTQLLGNCHSVKNRSAIWQLSFSQRTTQLFGNCHSVKEPLSYLATVIQSNAHSIIWQLKMNQSLTYQVSHSIN